MHYDTWTSGVKIRFLYKRNQCHSLYLPYNVANMWIKHSTKNTGCNNYKVQDEYVKETVDKSDRSRN